MKQIDVVNAEHDGSDEDDKRQRFLEGQQSKRGCNATYKKLISGLYLINI